jgi:hypothetical protein
MTAGSRALRRRITGLLVLFIIGLVLSGVTAIPLARETAFLQKVVGEGSATQGWWPSLAAWISRIHQGITEASRQYPFLLLRHGLAGFRTHRVFLDPVMSHRRTQNAAVGVRTSL